jgi:hypothetical protein
MGARLVGGLFKRLGGRAALGTAAKRLGGLALTEAKSAAAKAATEQAGNLAAQAVNAGADKLGGALGVTAGGGFLANLQGGLALAPGLLGNSGTAGGGYRVSRKLLGDSATAGGGLRKTIERRRDHGKQAAHRESAALVAGGLTTAKRAVHFHGMHNR